MQPQGLQGGSAGRDCVAAALEEEHVTPAAVVAGQTLPERPMKALRKYRRVRILLVSIDILRFTVLRLQRYITNRTSRPDLGSFAQLATTEPSRELLTLYGARPGPGGGAGHREPNVSRLQRYLLRLALTQLQFRLGRSVALIVGTLTADSRGSRLSA
jgi:hypothetical protein